MELTESQQKTAKSCYSMFTKWQGKTTSKTKTVSDYIKECIGGYPKGTKIKPAILSARVRGIETYSTTGGQKVNPADIKKAKELITEYKTKEGQA